MPRQQKNFRLPELTRQELDKLCDVFGMTESEVVILAVDTLFHRQSQQSLSAGGIRNNHDLVALIVNGEATADPTRTPLANVVSPSLETPSPHEPLSGGDDH
jgi:hypothetical protein